MAGLTVNSGLTKTLVDLAVMLGADRARILSSVELTDEVLADPDARVPMKHHMRTWDHLLAIPGQPFLGINMGRFFDLESLGVLGYVMAQAKTLGEAAAATERYAALVSDFFMPKVFAHADRAVWEQVVPPKYVTLRHPGEWCMSSALTTVRELTGTEWPVRAIRFQHPRPEDVSEITAFFGMEPLFGAPSSRLELDVACLAAPLRKANEGLFGYLTHRAEALVRQLRPDASLVDRVRKHLTQTLQDGEPRQADVARQFGMSERTLQRRLKEEGAVFAELLEQTRHELATLYLRERRLAAYEVAFLLGYSEPSAFYRAFKRWTGITPQEFRATAA